ncbi:hypothetical protein CLOM_g13500 [Closterium sp. NIES-68]|nr:hypothetical protein CLOM_g13500 [Closterium sp. NIES-68]GJP59745.1 hypothetical protein CLOP_g15116 [Closterium sp. NIES-67]
MTKPATLANPGMLAKLAQLPHPANVSLWRSYTPAAVKLFSSQTALPHAYIAGAAISGHMNSAVNSVSGRLAWSAAASNGHDAAARVLDAEQLASVDTESPITSTAASAGIESLISSTAGLVEASGRGTGRRGRPRRKVEAKTTAEAEGSGRGKGEEAFEGEAGVEGRGAEGGEEREISISDLFAIGDDSRRSDSSKSDTNEVDTNEVDTSKGVKVVRRTRGRRKAAAEQSASVDTESPTQLTEGMDREGEREGEGEGEGEGKKKGRGRRKGKEGKGDDRGGSGTDQVPSEGNGRGDRLAVRVEEVEIVSQSDAHLDPGGGSAVCVEEGGSREMEGEGATGRHAAASPRVSLLEPLLPPHASPFVSSSLLSSSLLSSSSFLTSSSHIPPSSATPSNPMASCLQAWHATVAQHHPQGAVILSVDPDVASTAPSSAPLDPMASRLQAWHASLALRHPQGAVILGIDPDVSGAVAVLLVNSESTQGEERGVDGDCGRELEHGRGMEGWSRMVRAEDGVGEGHAAVYGQIHDVPFELTSVGTSSRKRHSAQAIAALLHQLPPAPTRLAYLEHARPFPSDGKQGWYGSGFGFGVWMGVLAGSGFEITPVPSVRWKAAIRSQAPVDFTSKEDSRQLALALFPSLASFLKRKKDHGRAEALLIATYGTSLWVPVGEEGKKTRRRRKPAANDAVTSESGEDGIAVKADDCIAA